MPYRSNFERNAVIYQMWEEAKSIEEISLLTGIPRSTVGYYVRKFNAAARTGRAIPLPPSTKKQPTEILFGFLTKGKIMEYLLTLLKTCDAQTLYYNLAAMKLFAELSRRLGLTDEERELLSSAMTGLQTGAAPEVTDQKRKGPKLTDLFASERLSREPASS